MTTARRQLLLTTAVLATAGCARDDAPTSPDLAPVEATADARAYVVRDLGTLGGHYSFAWGINRHAEVVGSSDRKDGAFRAFLWRRGTMVGLGTLDQGHGSSIALDINDAGEVVGGSSSREGIARAFLWREGRMTELPTPGGSSSANGINNLGQIVGYAGTSGRERPSLWQNGGHTDLGTLGGAFGQATDINDRGQIVGGSRVSEQSDDLHAFLWQNGVMTDLGTLGGRNSWAYAINADGEIVGASERASGEEHAVMWKGGRIIDLGPGRALGINDEELKVGPASGGDAVPQVWRFRKAAGLPTLGRFGGSATAINHRGQIVGSSVLRSSDEHAVLWRLE
jgi:probable HAF family extracellular repeat protein